MTAGNNHEQDPRISQIQAFISDLTQGNVEGALPVGEQKDALDEIAISLNQLADSMLQDQPIAEPDDHRLIQLLDTIITIAALDFDYKAPVYGTGDIYDAVATGLNALGEELQASTVSRSFLDNIFASMVDPLIVLDEEGKIQMTNPAAVEMLGYSRDELIGRSLGVILNDPEMQDFMISTLNKIAYVRDKETTFRTKAGIEIPFSYSLSILRNNHGSYRGAVCVGRDITETKRVNLQIENSLREKEVLLKEIHHRVKNNLQIISSLLFLQSKRVEDKDTLSILQDSQNRVRAMSLIHEKLYQTDDLGNIELGSYIESLVQSLFASYGINSKIIDLRVKCDGVFFSVDMAIPCGVIINELVSNALKHGFANSIPKDSFIAVSVDRKPNDSWSLTVEDNGSGFPVDFDLESSKSLGLHLVQNLVDQLNGELKFNSSSAGTCFQIHCQPQVEQPSTSDAAVPQ